MMPSKSTTKLYHQIENIKDKISTTAALTLASVACCQRNGTETASMIVKWATDSRAFLVNSVGVLADSGAENVIKQRKVGNRQPGGYVASESLSLADSGSG
jgi:hypothetical protein